METPCATPNAIEMNPYSSRFDPGKYFAYNMKKSHMTAFIIGEDFIGDSNVALATQQSIKAYVDSQVATSDTLQEVTDNGTTTTNALQFGSNLGISGNTFFEGALSGTGAISSVGNISTDGDVTTDNALIRDNIQHVGDLTNEISFAANAQDFRTNNGFKTKCAF